MSQGIPILDRGGDLTCCYFRIVSSRKIEKFFSRNGFYKVSYYDKISGKNDV